jgi:hypothetical protein
MLHVELTFDGWELVLPTQDATSAASLVCDLLTVHCEREPCATLRAEYAASRELLAVIMSAELDAALEAVGGWRYQDPIVRISITELTREQTS